MLRIALRLLAAGCILPGLFHMAFGVQGDWLIGTTPTALIDPTLDSQNRFYGAIFVAYGGALWLCAGHVRRHVILLRWLLGFMFVGGLARLLSAGVHGWPTYEVMVLGASELLLPPILLVLMMRNMREVN